MYDWYYWISEVLPGGKNFIKLFNFFDSMNCYIIDWFSPNKEQNLEIWSN